MAHKDSVTEIIDAAPISRVQIAVFTFCMFISILDGFDTQAIAFVAPSISREWGLSPVNLGFIFSATLLGSVAGSAFFGWLADRIGRKRLIVATTIIFGLFSGACAFATSFHELLLLRLLGGIGMGGVVPNMLALASEYAPQRKRATIVTFTIWGFPAGAVLGGLMSGPLIASFGWPSVFIVGGVAPLLLALALIPFLPESLGFLAGDPRNRSRVVTILKRIAPDRAATVKLGTEGDAIAASGGQISALFAPGLAAKTSLLSATMFLSLFLTYLLVNWVPSLLAAAGMSVGQAILGAVAINLGGIVGSYLMSRMLDGHTRPVLLLAAGYLLSGIVIVFAGRVSGSVPAVLGVLGACGFFLIGTQMSTTAYTVSQFPVAVRGTGTGLVQAIGRTGSLIGPLIGGALLSTGLSSAAFFTLAFIPAALASLALLTLFRIGGMAARNSGKMSVG